MSEKKNTKPFYNAEIPSDWEVKTVKDVCAKFLNGGTPSTQIENLWTGEIPWITGADVNEQTISKVRRFITKKAVKESSTNIIPKGNLLLVTRTGVGKVAVAPFDVAISQDLTGLFLNKKLIDVNFAFYFFDGSETTLKKLNQGTSINGITRAVLANIKIPLPLLPEQTAIAQLLSTWDNAITKTQALIAQKELRKKWLMQNLLTGKKRLRVNDELGIMNEELKKVNLIDTFQFIKSYSISRDGLKTSEDKNATYCIHYGDIHALYENEFLDFSKQQNIPQLINALSINETDYLKNGDIIMADASEDYDGVGEAVEVCNLGNRKAIGGLHTIVLRGNAKIISPQYAAYLFSSENVSNELRKMANGTSVYSVSKSTLQNLSLIIHNSLKEQTAISQVLQAADTEIQFLKNKMEKLKEQKKGLMQVLLTGKKRLKI